MSTLSEESFLSSPMSTLKLIQDRFYSQSLDIQVPKWFGLVPLSPMQKDQKTEKLSMIFLKMITTTKT